MKLVRLESGYHLRRWVPVDIRKTLRKNEIWHSLETNEPEVAKIRACDIFSATSKFFIVVRNMTKSYIYHSENELVDDLETDHDKKILSKIIDTYELHVRELKAQYRLAEAEHYLERMQDYERLKNLTDAVQKAEPQLDAVLEYSKNNKDFNAYKSVELMKEQFSQIQTWVKPPEKRKTPILSLAVEKYLEAHTEKMTDSDKRGFLNTIKRFIEACGDKEILDYTGEDAGTFKELMEKMPENYGKSRNDTRTIFELIEYGKLHKSGRISEKTIKNHFARLSTRKSHRRVVHRVRL